MREPRWYHERWAILMLALLLPPVGLLAGMTSRSVSLARKLVAALSIVLAGGMLAAIEEGDHYLSRLALDMQASVHFQRAESRWALGHPREKLDSLRRASLLEPPPEVGNILGIRPEASEATYRLGSALLDEGDREGARRYLIAACHPKPIRDPFAFRESEARDGERELPPVYGIAQAKLVGIELDMGLLERAKLRLAHVLDGSHLRADHPEVILQRARILAREEPEEARRALLDVVWSFRLSHMARACTQLAELEEADGELDEELTFRLLALRLEPRDPDYLAAALETARRAEVSEVPVRAFYRALHLQSIDDAGAVAEQVYARLLDRNGDFAGAAICRLQAGGYREQTLRDRRTAALHFRAARELARQPFLQVEAAFKLGRCYARLGDIEEARKSFEQVLRLAPSTAFHAGGARRELARLEKSDETRRKMEKLDDWFATTFGGEGL